MLLEKEMPSPIVRYHPPSKDASSVESEIAIMKARIETLSSRFEAFQDDVMKRLEKMDVIEELLRKLTNGRD